MRQLLAFLLCVSIGMATTRHVKSSGGTTSGAAADSASAWTFTYSLNNSTVQPGDTIYLHGGTYNGTFTASVSGTSSSPVIYRNYNGQRVRINGGTTSRVICDMTVLGVDNILNVNCDYTWFWGLEIYSDAETKISTTLALCPGVDPNPSWPADIGQPQGVNTADGHGVGCKFIELVVHDTKQAFSLWADAHQWEVYGCVTYDNGWIYGTSSGHGHNFYIQTAPLARRSFMENCINFWPYSETYQVYGSSTTSSDSVVMKDNAFFNGWGRTGGLIAGGELDINISRGDVFDHNSVYDNIGRCIWFSSFPGPGYGNLGSRYLKFTDNTMWGASSAFSWSLNDQPTVSGNRVYYNNFTHETPPHSTDNGNTFTTSRPSWNEVRVTPSRYTQKRAHVVVWNSALLSSVPVDLSSFLVYGDSYVVVDPQNYYGTPLLTGTYTGGSVSVPMTSTTIRSVVGNDPRSISHTGQEFGVFIVTSSSPSSGGGPSPSITATTGTLADFGSVAVGTSSGSKTYTVSGTNLTGNVTVTAPSGFEVSVDNSSWYSTLTLTESGGTLTSTTVYARFSPSSPQSYSDAIMHTSSGATTRSVSVNGTGTGGSPVPGRRRLTHY